jgi:hypothetical protein
MDNAAFRDTEGALLNLVLESSDKQLADAVLLLTDALFTTAGGAEHRAADISVMMRSDATGINGTYGALSIRGVEGAVEVVSNTETIISIYATTGKLVKNETVMMGKNVIALPAGVYVINENKIIVK